MSAPDHLERIAESARDALSSTFEALAPGVLEAPSYEVLPAGSDALEGTVPPCLVAHVAPTDGVTGPAILVLSVAGTRRLAAVIGAIDEEEAEFGGDDVGDAELSAFREVTGKVTTAIASAMTAVIDREVSFRPASVRVAEGVTDVRMIVEVGTHAAAIPFTLLGEPGILAVLLPSGLAAPPASRSAAVDVEEAFGDTPLRGALTSVNVRVWAELGRTRMPTGHVVGLPAGTIVELDHDADDAVELYVDGQRYATGRLVVTDDDSWGVRIEQILTGR